MGSNKSLFVFLAILSFSFLYLCLADEKVSPPNGTESDPRTCKHGQGVEFCRDGHHCVCFEGVEGCTLTPGNCGAPEQNLIVPLPLPGTCKHGQGVEFCRDGHLCVCFEGAEGCTLTPGKCGAPENETTK